MEIRKICVAGAGLMGSGIAQVCAEAGYDVTLRDIEESFVAGGMARIKQNIARAVDKGRITGDEAGTILAGLRSTVDLNEAAAGADLVIEAIVEVMEVKKKLFAELETVVPDHCLFFTNTSGLSITEIAAATGRPDRFIGTHFFNPVPVMRLMEIIRGHETSDETLETARSWGNALGKEVIVVSEAPGFAVNRLLCTMLNEAFCALGEGIASAEDIDKGMVLGCNHPIGPLALSDLIGLDTLLHVMEGLHRELGDKYMPAPRLRQLVRAGHYGRKTGRGVFLYGSS